MLHPTTATARWRRAERLLFLPLVLVVLAVLLANTGVRVSPNAVAATTNVQFQGNVGAVGSTATNGCGGEAAAISLTLNAVATGGNTTNCTITFGSSNIAGITLTAADSDGGAFWPQNSGNFADTSADCAAMTGSDQVGYKVGPASTATVNVCSGNTSNSTVNNHYRPVHDTGEVVCTTNAEGSQTCQIIVGATEVGSNAPAGNYTGTINFTTS